MHLPRSYRYVSKFANFSARMPTAKLSRYLYISHLFIRTSTITSTLSVLIFFSVFSLKMSLLCSYLSLFICYSQNQNLFQSKSNWADVLRKISFLFLCFLHPSISLFLVYLLAVFSLIVLIVRSYENVQLRLFPAAVIVVNDLKKTTGSWHDFSEKMNSGTGFRDWWSLKKQECKFIKIGCFKKNGLHFL